MMNEVKSSSLRCYVIIWCPQQSFGVGLEVSIWVPLSPFGIDQSSWSVVWDATCKQYYFIYYSFFTLIFYFTSLWCMCVFVSLLGVGGWILILTCSTIPPVGRVAQSV